MRDYVVFRIAIPGPRVTLGAWRIAQARDQRCDATGLLDGACIQVAQVTLAYTHQGMDGLNLRADRFAVSLRTGSVLTHGPQGITALGHVYDLLGYPAIAALDPRADAMPLRITPGEGPIARRALQSVLPDAVIAATFRETGSLPVFLTPKSLVRMAIEALTAIGESVIDPSSGDTVRDAPEARFRDLFPEIAPMVA